MTKRKNTTGPNRQLTRKRRTQQATRPLRRPPWSTLPEGYPYRDIVHVSDQVHSAYVAHGIPDDPRLEESSKDLMETMTRLGPTYRGQVPIAAFYLDHQIRADQIPIYGPDDRYWLATRAELAAGGMRFVPEQDEVPPPDEIGQSLHSLHAAGWIVLDEVHAVHTAIPPQHRGEKWFIGGVSDPSEWPA